MPEGGAASKSKLARQAQQASKAQVAVLVQQQGGNSGGHLLARLVRKISGEGRAAPS